MLLDIGTGIMSALFLSHLFGIPLTWTFILWGILFNLLPDTELLIRSRKRNLLHLPIFYIITGAIAISFIYKWSFSALFTLTALFHFAHDSFGPTPGIRWLWPFSKKRYKEKLPKKTTIILHRYAIFEFLVFALSLLLLLLNLPA